MKHFYAVVAFLAVMVTAGAQTVTKKDLQGSWKAVVFKSFAIHIEPEKGIAKLTESGKTGLTQQEVAQKEKEMKEGIAEYRDNVLIFKGDKVTFSKSGEEVAKGSFKIETEDGSTALVMDFGDGNILKGDVVLHEGVLSFLDYDNNLFIDYRKI